MRGWRALLAPALLAAGLAQAEVPAVAPGDFARELVEAQPPLALDVRTAGEFAEGHVPGAVNIPVQDLERQLSRVPREREVVVYCERGPRAGKAAALLEARGYTRLRVLHGSMSGWREARLPVER